MALFLAFALVFGTLVPVVAWAEEPANVEEPSVEASEPEAPLEEETQTEPEESRPEEETEGKKTAAPGELEFSKENTPTAQGESAAEKTFTVTKRAYDNPSDPEKLVGDFDTFFDANGACAQGDRGNLYIITMNSDYDIPADESVWDRGNVRILLRSKEGQRYTLKRLGTRMVTYVSGGCELETQNIIFDGNNDGEFTFISVDGKLTLGKGTVLQNFIDIPTADGPAIFMLGTSTLTIEPGAVIRNNKADKKTKYSGVIYAQGSNTVNIRGGEFINNSCDTSGGVIGSGSNAVVNISGGTFKNNTAQKVGGVINAYGEVNITGGTFEGNEASTGGAVYAKKASIQKAEFLSNKATWGGAVFIAGEATIQNSVFKDNKTSSSGGALYTSGVTLVENSEFQSNKSIQGGAVYTKANITLKNSKLHSNTAEKWGGAVFCTENTQNTIESSDFVSNHAKQWGGAIFSNGELDVSGTSFTKNEANDGGAVLAIAKAKFSKNIFTFNHAKELGGAVVVANVADIANTTFESNKAQNGGAIAISSEDAKVDIKESAFKKNYAEHQGGAISDAAAQYEPKITDPKAYRNLTTDARTLFQGNQADGGLFQPPENYEEFTNLQFDPQSDVKHGKLTRESLLNNYDVNYDNKMRTITYDANGGRFDNGMKIKTSEYPVDANITIMKAPTRRGYTFQYWKGSEYQPGDPYTVKDHHTFVAQWKKDERTPQPPMTEQIIVDPNGGTFSDGTTGRKTYDLYVGETFLLPDAPTREGYKFIAWQGKDAEYQPGYPYIVKTGGEVFTAQWEEEKKPEEKPSVTPNIKTPKGTPLTPDEIAKILAGMKKTVPAIPRAGVGK